MERGGYWYHKLHIYLYPFYYINYTLTTMGAMEFKKKYAENKDGGVAGLSQALQDRRQPQLSGNAALRESGQSLRARLRGARLRVRRGNPAQADRGAGEVSASQHCIPIKTSGVQ